VPFLLGLALIAGLAALLYESDLEQLKESNFRKIAAVNARLLLQATEIPFYLAMSLRYDDESILASFREKQQQLLRNQKKLVRLLKKTPELADGAVEVQKDVETVMSFLNEIAEAKKKSLPEFISKLGVFLTAVGNERTSAIVDLAKMLRQGEIRTRQMENQQARIRRQQSMILGAGIAGNLLAGVMLALFFRRGIARRLQTISENTVLLSAGLALGQPLSGSDEIAQLDRAFHAMDHELKQAAEREKELFDNASDVICVLDPGNKFVKVNLASRRNWGYSPAELTLMVVTQILPAGELAPVSEQIEKGKSTGEPFTFESRVITAGGAEIETSWSAFWSQHDRRLYCVVHDISERKRSETMKKKFLAMVSSDLKKPLSVMSASVAILMGSPAGSFSEKALEKLKMAGRNLQRLLRLVNDLLQVAEMEAGNIEIKKEWSDPEELLMRSVQEVETLAAKQNIKLELQSCQTQWFVDPNRIVQVLVNLLSNAIKFSPPGQTVTLSAQEQDDRIEIKVRDRGRGVPATHREAIFEKFKQVEAADGRRKFGTGLGLPICKQIVEDHDGSIGVESVEGQGSTFWFSIPRSQTAQVKIQADQDNVPVKAAGPAVQTVLPEATGAYTQSIVLKPQGFMQALPGNIRLSHKGVLLVGVPLLFELLLVGAMSLILFQVDCERRQELHYRNIAFLTTRLTNIGFMMAVGSLSQNRQRDWLNFKDSYDQARKTTGELAGLVKGDRVGTKYLEPVTAQIDNIGNWLDRTEDRLQSSGKTQQDYRVAMGGRRHMLPFMMEIARWLQVLCDDAEKKEFVSPDRLKVLRSQQAGILLLGLFVNISGSLALALYFSRDITSRLQILADNAMRLAKERLLNPPLIGTDEIAALDRTFHETAGALSEARKKERAVFDNSQDVICALTSGGAFRSVNPAAQIMFGYSKKELVGRELSDIVFSEDRGLVKSILEAGVKEHRQFELRIVRKDESTVHMLWSCSRAAEQGDVLCVARDITAVKELEKIRQEFLSMVSHDLRTPLTSIQGVTRLILAGALGTIEERQKNILEKISRSGDQLLDLVNDLMDLEKLEAGKMQLVAEEVEISELLKLCLTATREQSRVVLSRDAVSPGLSLKLDRDRFVQAISSILNNCCDRSPPGATVTLSAVCHDSSLELVVNDQASVLSASEFEGLFDRFRVAGAIAGPGGAAGSAGSGLALPIARRIIESHGGDVTAQACEAGNLTKIRIQFERLSGEDSK
jgi:PAS domain S-box-containing protein